jgi:hypothetical protein
MAERKRTVGHPEDRLGNQKSQTRNPKSETNPNVKFGSETMRRPMRRPATRIAREAHQRCLKVDSGIQQMEAEVTWPGKQPFVKQEKLLTVPPSLWPVFRQGRALTADFAAPGRERPPAKHA